MAEFPFQIAVPDESITLLHQKLALTVFPDELEGADSDYGVRLADLQRLVARWQEGYDWRKYEAQLNAVLPQFTRDIAVEGFGPLNVHYVHMRSEVEGAVPLLFVHGWPGSFYEVKKILPLLVAASPEHPSFHVVALSLPGYGFSEAPTKPGFALKQYAEVGNKVMLALGYNEYVTQGGDWGYLITKTIARVYGREHCKAWHTNMQTYALSRQFQTSATRSDPSSPYLLISIQSAAPPHPIRSPLLFLSHLLLGYTPAEKEGLNRTRWFFEKGSGYFREQATQPQTLGYSLADSPAGLLAWIYEKLVNWTDGYPWDDDEVLTWVSIYWFSRAGPAASLRIYYEVIKSNPNIFEDATTTTIPMGYSYFPKELIILPRRWLRAPNLAFESKHESGGHFAAYEKPEELVGDLRRMFGKSGPAFGVVPGKTGYI